MSNQDKKAEFAAVLADQLTAAVERGIKPLDEAIKEGNAKVAAFEERLKEAETQRAAHDLPGAHETHDGEKYDFGKVLRATMNGPQSFQKIAPLEYAMSQEIRAQGTVDDTKGGFLVPSQTFENDIVPLLRPNVVALQAGMGRLAAVGSPVEIPVETTGPTVDAVAENAANTSSDLAFDNLTATPHTAQSFVKASNRFLAMGAGAESFIQNRMLEEIALTWDQWAIKGTGANGQPAGILNTTNVNTGTMSASSGSGTWIDHTAYLDLLDIELAVAEDDALKGTPVWLFHPKHIRLLRAIKSDNIAAGTDKLEIDRKVFTGGGPREIIGYNYFTTTQLTAGASSDGECVFGDFSKSMLVTWGNMEINSSTEAGDSTGSAFTQRQTWIVAHMDVDVVVTQPKAFCAVTAWDTAS